MAFAQSKTGDNFGPHENQKIFRAGPSPQEAGRAVILIHGRGATAQSLLELFDVMHVENLAAIAPQAAGNSWYPNSFLAPLESNQPFLDSALNRIESIIHDLMAHGMPSSRIGIAGFSQGACLTTEFAARHPRRYGAIIALTGGLIGPAGTPRNYYGSFGSTPIFLGSSDPDPHVPYSRVLETEVVFTRMKAKVEIRRYPGMEHTINQDEVGISREMLAAI
jgi:predicted esterase